MEWNDAITGEDPLIFSPNQYEEDPFGVPLQPVYQYNHQFTDHSYGIF